MRDQAKRIVLKVTRLTAQANVLDILARLLRGDEKLTIVVSHVRVERAEADLIPADDGLPTLLPGWAGKHAEDNPRPSGDTT